MPTVEIRTRDNFNGEEHKYFINSRLVDTIGFGLSRSITHCEPDAVAKSIMDDDQKMIRIVCPDPDSDMIPKQYKFELSWEEFQEEEKGKGGEILIVQNIKKLLNWYRRIKLKILNDSPDKADRIQLKCYNDLPLFYYLRRGDKIDFGPYMLGYSSDLCLTVSFKKEYGKGSKNSEFKMLTDYFDKLWDDGRLKEYPVIPSCAK